MANQKRAVDSIDGHSKNSGVLISTVKATGSIGEASLECASSSVKSIRMIQCQSNNYIAFMGYKASNVLGKRDAEDAL